MTKHVNTNAVCSVCSLPWRDHETDGLLHRLLDERDRDPGPLVWHPSFPEQFEAERVRRRQHDHETGGTE